MSGTFKRCFEADLVPLVGIESKDVSSSGALEDCLLLLKVTLKKLKDVRDGATLQIVFFTRNMEKPKLVCGWG